MSNVKYFFLMLAARKLLGRANGICGKETIIV
jgi:hypothetical protein